MCAAEAEAAAAAAAAAADAPCAMDQRDSGSSASGTRAILEQRDLLHAVLLRLGRGDAVRLSACCRGTYACVTELRAAGSAWHKATLLVTCSDTARLLELDARTGGVVSHTCQRYTGRRRLLLVSGRSKLDGGLTGLAISPYDHDVYVSDYEMSGVRQLCGRSLRQKREFAGAGLCCPEGLAFAGGALFVASAGNCCLVRLNLVEGAIAEVLNLGWEVIPWGVAAEPECAAAASSSQDEMHLINLFVAVDYPSYSLSKVRHRAPKNITGRILRVTFDNAGKMLLAGRFSNTTIKRPGGIHFTHDGDLLVTSMDKQIVRVAGPRGEVPGTILQVIKTAAWLEVAIPRDVIQISDVMVVSLSKRQTGKDEGGYKKAGIAIATLSGQLLSIAQNPLLAHPDILAVD